MPIQLDQKHGVNPSVETCFLCGGDKGLIFWGQLRNSTKEAFKKSGIEVRDGEAPRKIATNKEPCDKCKEYMEKGVILISCRGLETDDRENPYRTGGWVVVRDQFIEKVVDPQPC